MKPDPVTYGELERLLIALGLEATPTMGQGRTYFDAGSDMLVLLPEEKPDTPARAADVLSVRQNLVDAGHLDGHLFEEFIRTRTLPARR